VAKQINSNGHNKPDSFYSTPDIFTTSTGVQVRFIGLNQQRLELLRNAGKLPDVPTREIPNDLGAPQREKLSADDLVTDEEKAAWAEYEEKKSAVERRRDENVMKYTFTAGFEVLDLTEEKLEKWKLNEEEDWGIEIPTGDSNVLLQYINAKVIGNNDDYAEIMAGIMERTGVPADMLDELRNSFRNQVRRSTPAEVNEEPVPQE
jgi:hypothetical protein